MEEEFVALRWPGYIWAVVARYISALAQDTIPRLDNVTRQSLPFTAPLADFPSLSEWYHFNGMFCTKNKPMKNDTTSSNWPKSARSSLNVSDVS